MCVCAVKEGGEEERESKMIGNKREEAGQGVLRNETGCCCTGEQQSECVPVCLRAQG